MTHRLARPGLSLLEVILALTIFLMALLAIGHLLNVASELALETHYYSEGTQRCQSKMNEVAGGAIQKFLDFTNKGAEFVFGPLATPGPPPIDATAAVGGGPAGEILKNRVPARPFIFAVSALPAVIFVSSFFTVLYYLGALQLVVMTPVTFERAVDEQMNAGARHGAQMIAWPPLLPHGGPRALSRPGCFGFLEREAGSRGGAGSGAGTRSAGPTQSLAAELRTLEPRRGPRCGRPEPAG